MIDSPLDDGIERPYICPCGKSYLSYPALFTHVKQKHHGNPPGDIVRPKAINKRGRPRKNPNQPSQEPGTPPHQQKICLDRFNLPNEEDQSYLQLMRQKAKKHPKRSYDFAPPISFPRLRSKTQPALIKCEQPAEVPHPQLQNNIITFFQRLENVQPYLNSEGLQALISSNQTYGAWKSQERCLSRRPIGIDQWQMDFRTALLQFLDWSSSFLSLWGFKNIELMVSLLSYFYSQMLPSASAYTTTNYLLYLNLFTKTLFHELAQLKLFNQAAILQPGLALQTLAFIHEWFVLEGISHYEVRNNPQFPGLSG